MKRMITIVLVLLVGLVLASNASAGKRCSGEAVVVRAVTTAAVDVVRCVFGCCKPHRHLKPRKPLVHHVVHHVPSPGVVVVHHFPPKPWRKHRR